MTTHPIMHTTTNNNHSISTVRNNAASSSTTSHDFSVYQHTIVSVSEANIRTLVYVLINNASYHKAIIVRLYFCQILTHAETPSVSISALIFTVAVYFDISTIMAERKVEVAVSSIYHSIFCNDNIVSVSYFNFKEKFVTIYDHLNYPSDVSGFIFYSTISPHLLESRVSDSINSVELIWAYLTPPLFISDPFDRFSGTEPFYPSYTSTDGYVWYYPQQSFWCLISLDISSLDAANALG